MQGAGDLRRILTRLCVVSNRRSDVSREILSHRVANDASPFVDSYICELTYLNAASWRHLSVLAD